MVPHLARVEREGVDIAEENYFLGASVPAGKVEVERTLYDGVSGAAFGRRPEGRNAVRDEVTQGKGPRRLQAAGLKRHRLWLREPRWSVVWRRLLGRWSGREAAVRSLVKSCGLVVQRPCHLFVHVIQKIE